MEMEGTVDWIELHDNAELRCVLVRHLILPFICIGTSSGEKKSDIRRGGPCMLLDEILDW